MLNRILDAYEPAANRIAVTVSVSFVEERERVIKEQQEAMRELSTPVLQLRDRLLILPIIGVLDSAAGPPAHRATVGRRSATKRATVVVIDITGVATIDSHGRQPPRADRRGLAPDGRQQPSSPACRRRSRRPWWTLGVDLGMMQDGRRPPGRHRGSRAAGSANGSPDEADTARTTGA